MGRNKVANAEPAPQQPFTIDMVKQLADVMGQHDLSEVYLEFDAGRLRLRRGPHGVAAAAIPMQMPAAPAARAQAGPAAAAPEPVKPSRPLLEIKSEAIGTFYCRPNPESEPYVKVGSRITPTTVVGLIEAMKMFNEITAGVSGTVAEVLVDNQQAVEYGTVLFKVDPS